MAGRLLWRPRGEGGREAACEPRVPTHPLTAPPDSRCSGLLPLELAWFLLLLMSAETEQRPRFFRVIIITAGDCFSPGAFRSRVPIQTSALVHTIGR